MKKCGDKGSIKSMKMGYSKPKGMAKSGMKKTTARRK
jgi:hypothetical protein